MNNDKQIAEAVECWLKGEHIPKSDECLGVLLDLATKYLELATIIEEKDNRMPCDECKSGDSNCHAVCDDYEKYVTNSGYNLGRQEAILAMQKRLERLPNLISDIRYVQPGGYPTDNKIMADAIRENMLMGGAEYGTSRK